MTDFLRGFLVGLMLEAVVAGGFVVWGLNQRATVAEANIQAIANMLNQQRQPQAQPRVAQPKAEEVKP